MLILWSFHSTKQSGRADRDLAVDLFGLEIRDRVALVDLGQAARSRRVEQDGRGERGLPRRAVADQGDVPDHIGRIVFHPRASSIECCVVQNGFLEAEECASGTAKSETLSYTRTGRRFKRLEDRFEVGRAGARRRPARSPVAGWRKESVLGVEEEPGELPGLLSATVAAVADDRVAGRGEVDPDLMGPAGQGPDLEEGRLAERPQDPEKGLGRPGLAGS